MEGSFLNSSSPQSLQSDLHSSSLQPQQFNLEKLTAHVQFMEKQFRKNLKQQRIILHQLTRQRSELKERADQRDTREDREAEHMVLTEEESHLVKELLLGYLRDFTTGMQNWSAKQLMDAAIRKHRSNHTSTHNRTMSQQYHTATFAEPKDSGKQIRNEQSPTVRGPWVEKETVESVESMDNLSLNSFNLSNSRNQHDISPLDNLCLDCGSSIIIDALPKTSRVKKPKSPPTHQLNFRLNIIRKTNAPKSPDPLHKRGEKSHHSSTSNPSTPRTITINPSNRAHATHKTHKHHRD